jgi:DNA-binding MarR family transcriptional regulator
MITAIFGERKSVSPSPIVHSHHDFGDDFRRVVLSLANQARRERTDRRMTLTQASILGQLYRHGSLLPSEIAEYEQLLAPSVTRALNTMEQRGLVERSRGQGDRRQVVITITELGKKVIEADRERRNEFFSGALTSLPEAGQRRVIRALKDLEEMSLYERPDE